MKEIGANAQKPNPALKAFEPLIGEWETVGTHPYLPGQPLKGRAVFEWGEGGAFVIARSEIDQPQFPHGIEIFGSDDAAHQFFMLHFDERGVSRKYDVFVEGNIIRWERHDPDFSQRMVLTIADGGKTMTSKGEMSKSGGAWEGDLELMYMRVG